MKRQAELLIEKYQLPDWLRRHVAVVRDCAWDLAEGLSAHGAAIDVERVTAAAWLHDIGRSPLVRDEDRDHAELSALVLAVEGMPELVEMVRRHPIYAILDPARRPRSLEEKVVHYADRRGGLAVLSLEDRAREQVERYPEYAEQVARCLPLEKELERELFATLPFGPEQLCARR